MEGGHPWSTPLSMLKSGDTVIEAQHGLSPSEAEAIPICILFWDASFAHIME